MTKYADDTAIYVSDKEFKIIESKLSSDMCEISNWFDENELIMNLKKGKTEASCLALPKNYQLKSVLYK